MEKYKTCSKCGQVKPIDAFGNHKSSKDGLRSQCRVCNSLAAKNYRLNNPDKVRQAKKRWAKNNPDKMLQMWKTYQAKNKTKLAKYNKEYRQENLEHLKNVARQYRLANKDKKSQADKLYAQQNPQVNREASRRYRTNNPERAKAAGKKWRAANKEHFRLKSHERRVKIKSVSYLVSVKDVKRLLAKPCLYCGNKSEHIDHIIPLSRGGKHSIGNLTGACSSCNLSKGSQFITEWKRKRGHGIRSTSKSNARASNHAR